MRRSRLTIGLVRRGHSETGGAEHYLKRLARGLNQAGHHLRLFTDASWPAREWPAGTLTRVRGDSARRFADEVEKARRDGGCDVLLSMERIWNCDLYRAGDGIHAAWLRRRGEATGFLRRAWRRLGGKDGEILELERSLFLGGAQRVIANSLMVKREAQEFYEYPADRIDLVRNGVPLRDFTPDPDIRASHRRNLRLEDGETAVLFVGSGWGRKGVRYAIDATKSLGNGFRLLIAGRGRNRRASGRAVQNLGAVRDLAPLYAAADVFVLPTIYDPFSNACLEALASGLPVVTTHANGFSEIIEDGVHGSILDQPTDIEQIAAAIAFWSVAERRAAARPAILARASEFDISRNVDETLDVVYQIAASAAPVSGKIRNT